MTVPTRRAFIAACGAVLYYATGCRDEPAGAPTPVGHDNGSAAPPSASTSRCDPQMTLACEASCAESVTDYQESDIVAQPGARAGDLVRCPVSCVVVRAREENAVAFDDREYFACCSACANRLRAEPRRFLPGSNA